jgi:hypothetical protein
MTVELTTRIYIGCTLLLVGLFLLGMGAVR